MARQGERSGNMLLHFVRNVAEFAGLAGTLRERGAEAILRQIREPVSR
jgi:hypothetical protein